MTLLLAINMKQQKDSQSIILNPIDSDIENLML